MGILSAAVAAAATAALERAADKLPKENREPFERTNHRGEPVTLLEGPIAVLGALAGRRGVEVRRQGQGGRAARGLGVGCGRRVRRSARTTQAKGFRGHLARVEAR